MSIQDTAISLEEARRKAAEEVRHGLGTFLRIGNGSFDQEAGKFRFPLRIRSPKMIQDNAGELVDVRYYSELDLGEVTVDGSTREVDRPRLNTIKRKIREQEDEVEIAVQKALVSAAGESLSHLPFPENQFAPLEDILAELLLEGDMTMADIELMDEKRSNDRYHEYVENLIEIDLIERNDRTLTNGNVLLSLADEAENFQKALNSAIGRYFEHHVGEFNMIRRTLGPYLVLAGYYYRRALEVEEMPRIEEWELRRAIEAEYTGRQKKMKLFKLSRYLVHLEDVGLLEPIHQNGERVWVGSEDVRSRLRQQEDFLSPYETLQI